MDEFDNGFQITDYSFIGPDGKEYVSEEEYYESLEDE